MDARMEEALRNLLANNFDARSAENTDAAKEIVALSISKDMIVDIGDSATVRQVGIIEELEKNGVRILNPFSRELTTDHAKTTVRDDISRQTFSCDVLVVGTNAVTRDGKLVNIDAVGNRVASMIFGPRKVFIIAGRNKIVKDVDEALYRIKNLIAPFHARTKGFATPCAQTGRCSVARINLTDYSTTKFATPCAQTGRCSSDCSAPRRICSVTSIIEKRPWRTEISVILINEDLELSWDETWSEDRILKVKSNYEKVTWVFASARAT